MESDEIASHVAAAMATAFSVIAMVGVTVHTLNMEHLAASLFAGFLECAMVAAFMRARKLVVRGHSPSGEMTLTWFLSGASGIFAAGHEVIVAGGFTGVSITAAALRLFVPIVACLGWHASLHVVAQLERPTQREERVAKAMWSVAKSARHVNDANKYTVAVWRWQLRRAQERLMRVVPPTSPELIQLDAYMAQMRLIDVLPTMTRHTGQVDNSSVATFMAAATGHLLTEVTGHTENGQVVAAYTAPIVAAAAGATGPVMEVTGEKSLASTMGATRPGHSQAFAVNAVISRDNLAGASIGRSHIGQTGPTVTASALQVKPWPGVAGQGRSNEKAARQAATAEVLADRPTATVAEILAELKRRGVKSSAKSLQRDRRDLGVAASSGQEKASRQLVAV